MKRSIIAVTVAAALVGGCRLYFWAGSHELAIPPEPEATPAPTATPEPTPRSVY